MKNIIKFWGIVALVAVIGFSMITCSNEEEEEALGTDDNPDLTVPSLGAIGDFSSAKGYSAITQDEADQIVSELEDLLNELEEDINYELSKSPLNKIRYNYGRSALGRAIQNGTLEFKLSELRLAKYINLTGNVKVTASFDDDEDIVFPIKGSGSGAARLELLDGFKYEVYSWDDYGDEYEIETYEAIGVITGSANVNNVVINSENDMSGSAGASAKIAVNLASTSEKKWVKLISDITVTASNLSNQTITATANIKAYGDSANPLVNRTINVTLTPDKVTVTK